MSLCFVFGGGFVFGPTGTELYEDCPQVRQACADVLGWTGVDVAALLDVDFTERPHDKHLLELRQLALSCGVVDQLAGMGVRPDVVGGMSLGGKVAASLAGAISRADLCGLIQHESTAPRIAPDGRARGVASVALGPDDDLDWFCGSHRPGIHLAADGFIVARDGRRLLLLSGYLDELQGLAAQTRLGVVSVLSGWGAWHSPLQQHVGDFMRPRLLATPFHDPRLPLYSALRPGRHVTAEQVRAEFLDNYTHYVSMANLYPQLAGLGVQLALMPGSGAVPAVDHQPFAVLPVETPDDIEDALSTVYDLGLLAA